MSFGDKREFLLNTCILGDMAFLCPKGKEGRYEVLAREKDSSKAKPIGR
jgi:hypothetical protein